VLEPARIRELVTHSKEGVINAAPNDENKTHYCIVTIRLEFILDPKSKCQCRDRHCNGKWAIAHDKNVDSNGVSAQAIAQCKAKGGADAKVVYATSNGQAAHGAVAVSDNGTGKIVGFSFMQTTPHRHMAMDFTHEAERAAIKDCQKKGGQNPKIATSW
jgi:hypothetical protein